MRGLLLGAALLLVGAPSPALAAEIRVVLSDDSAPYQEAFEAIRASLQAQDHVVSRVHADKLDAGALDHASLVVAVGVRAAESLIPVSSRPPLLAILVPRDWYLKHGQPELAKTGSRVVSAIYVDQPLERQARLIRLALPEVRRVGLVTGDTQAARVREIEIEMQKQGLLLVHETIASERSLIGALETVLSSSEILLAWPDPLAFNRNTAQSVFLTSYRYRDPVLGYSRSLTRAGALLSLYSSPTQIGRQAGEWIGRALQANPLRLPAPANPTYFSVSINAQVARSLAITLPAEAELVRRLGGGQ